MKSPRILIAGVLVIAGAIAIASNLRSSDPTKKVIMRSADAVIAEYGEEKLETEVRQLCSQCHSFPDPQLLPAYQWSDEINRGLRFHEESGNKNLPMPASPLILAWFQQRAKKLDVAKGSLETDATIFGEAKPGPMQKAFAAVSGLLAVKTSDANSIICLDMIHGWVRETNVNDPAAYKNIHRATNPSRIRICDLSDEFETEYLLSDLGTSGVTDDMVGRVQWMRKNAGDEEFTVTTICDQLGRTADARSADFDGDGDEDVVIAEFGWEKTGSVVLLENVDGEFKRSTIDKRHGAVEIELADMNEDGLMDFVAIFGQEIESVEVFHNLGDLKFEPTQLYKSEIPAFGMSSVSITDADGDGDRDILFSSGDMYDSFQIHDHHGLYLLTNEGSGRFTSQLVGNQAAVLSSQAGDIDGDGDTDFVASSFIPQLSPFYKSKAYPAVVVYEQTEPGVWQQRVLKAGNCSNAAVELTDLDADGDLDLVSGILHDDGGSSEPAWFYWMNTSK